MTMLMSWNDEYGTFVQGKSINEQDCDLDAEKTTLDLWMFIATVHEKQFEAQEKERNTAPANH